MWIDLTFSIDDNLPQWPGSSSFEITYKKIHNCITSNIYLPLHYGTHIDAPRHFIPDGKTIDQYNINELSGIAEIIETGNSDNIQCNHIKTISCSIVFFKTKNLMLPDFQSDYCYIPPETALVLIKKKVKIIGIDYLSVECFKDKNFTTHKLLLDKEILLVEGLNLQAVSQGKYEIMIIPLKINAEASPARVLARPILE